MIIDKKFDDFALSPDMFKVFNDYIDKFISLVSDMMSNNQYNSDFDILYKKIINVYRNIVDKHYSDEYSDESEY